MTSKSPPPPSRVKTKSPVNQVPKQQSSAPVRLKTVVRRLPANLPEAVFWQSVEPWVSEETASWKLFYPGKLRKKLNKENISSRAYILFKNEELLAVFSREYDGHLFRDKQGNESQAVVEFAPNQKVPPEKKKVDSRHATIQQDEDYLSFLASLQNPQPKPIEIDVDALLASTQPPEEPKTTPLLAALREQKQSAQEKKLAASEATKGHSRKGAGAAVPAQKSEVADAVPPTGKKGKKGKGAPAAAASTPSAPTATNPASKPGGASRSRPKPSNTPASSASVAPASSTTLSTGKEPAASGENEASQRRNRPMLGLQSRQLQAALSGAGVAVTPTSPSSSSLAPVASGVPAPAAGASTRPSGGAPRGARGGGGGEKRSNEKNKDGAPKNSGGGRGGKEKSRPRHPPGEHGPPTVLTRATDATPRILSRQDSTTTALSSGDLTVRDRAATRGSQEAGGGRGRGGRRGRGQS